ncbi:hypothetical protein ILUMI_24103 [Ignelater luminosus]|uniref:Uracil-DNA glycosylase n=1 Tax=Ignelater luminosus TaxID=2038154 RepID=A0A8K0CE57_IGNLU|nr:hypothetical protein ILUMI_24103 [Ignelater luminosus]
MDLVSYAKLKPGWVKFFDQELQQKYFVDLLENTKKAYERKVIYPPKDLLFNPFYTTDLPDIQVVILGQGPYHEPDQANGLAFSVNPGINVPPLLKNIFKEIERSLKITIDKRNGDLTRWSNQGVFLLNGVLTVESSLPRSCQYFNWQVFTDKVLTFISEKSSNVVFVLWGEFAKRKERLIKNSSKHLILKSGFPSPDSKNSFFYNNHFVLINEYLKKHGKKAIDFQ